MAKNKKPKSRPPRPRPQNPPQARRRAGLVDNPVALHVYGGSTAFVPSDTLPAHGTMAEEVRNTLFHRRDFMGRDARLRHQPVVFVSAGLMDPLKDFEIKPNDISAKPASPAPTLLVTSEAQAPPDRPQSRHSPARSASPLFVIDTTGDKSLQPATRPAYFPPTKAQPCHESDSSEDVILFKGRDQSRRTLAHTEASQTPHTVARPLDPMDLPELTIELDHIRSETVDGSAARFDGVSKVTIVSKAPQEHVNDLRSNEFIPLDKPKRSRIPRQSNARPKRDDVSDEEAAIIADYIANMREDADSEEEAADVHPGLGSHAFHMLRDLGGSDSDAVPARIAAGDDSSESSDDDDGEDEADEDAERRRAEAQDAKLARLLAKQEELGLGGDDIVLFDDAGSDDDDGDGWQIAPKHTPRRRKKKGSSKEARIVQKKGQYPSATKMAEAFDDLDLMDWHRPSLNNFKSMNKRQAPEFDVSDSDLDEAMALAWKKDRLKKAEKKKAREQLRSQGLLGKNVNPDDLRIKYRGGMSIDDMEVEFETFLTSTKEQLLLPPFDRKGRQTVHLIANKFKIKSQSAGKGNTRCPVLYRTKGTLPFDRDYFNNVFTRIKQSWFPRVDVDDQVVSEAKIFRARSDVAAARAQKRGAVSLREGEVVGQHASELGVENKGRAMLEKMGWSKGMALGTEDNRGIIVPITHVVKKGKAGLGDI